MERIGERIKKVRLEKGLSLEEVHRKTKIHMNVLKAIEEDALVNFSPIYIKGFIKIYCNFLAIDPKEFIADYKEVKLSPAMNSDSSSKTQVSKQANRQVKTAKVSKLPSIKLNNPKLLSLIKTIILIAVVLLLTIGVLKFTKFIFVKAGSMFSKHKQAPLAEITSKQEKKTVSTKAQKSKPQEQVASIKVKQSQENFVDIRLAIRAKDDCWMQVKLDGKTIFQNILKKGRFENWKAKEKIELSLGNAGVVEIEVNGKLISSLGRRGQALKNILITRDGLSTSR